MACIFSRQWTDRETSMKHLSRITQSTLIHAVQDSSDPGNLDTEVTATAHQVFEGCCAVVAFMCKDPVYRVYVAALVRHT